MSMGEGIVTIPMSEYKKLRDDSTRIRVLLDHLAHYGRIYAEDIYLILGMNEDAEMEKEKREQLNLELLDLGKKEIEVIGG